MFIKHNKEQTAPQTSGNMKSSGINSEQTKESIVSYKKAAVASGLGIFKITEDKTVNG